MTGETIAAVRRAAVARLSAAGIEDTALDARLLVQAATGLDAAALIADPDRGLTDDERMRLDALVTRRALREPISQILGRAGFWTLDLAVSADVLTPRPETEQVLEVALVETRERGTGRVLDLGVGSGALVLAFLAERPGWSGVGVDASEAALAIARRNADACGVAHRVIFVRSNWDEGLPAEDRFDLVLSNPPYIPSADIEALAPEVRDHEPRLALDGGEDGLDAYRALGPRLASRLAPGGVAVLEVGAGQGAAVARLMGTSLEGAAVRIGDDLAGRDRSVVVRPEP